MEKLSLEDCKDKIAIDNDYQSWDDLYESETDYSARESYLEDSAEIYANQFKLKIDYKDHEKIVITNLKGDTYTSKSEDLMDFFHNYPQ